MKIREPTIRILLGCVLLSCFSAGYAQDKPNIVLVFMDNFGWGEPGFNGGGIIRGAVILALAYELHIAWMVRPVNSDSS